MYSFFYENKKLFGCSIYRVTCQFENKQTKKKTEDGEHLFLNPSVNRFWLTWKSYSWFSKVFYGQPSIIQSEKVNDMSLKVD